MDWLSTPVTMPAGVFVLIFSVFSTALGTALGVIVKIVGRFFTQQDMVMKALTVADRAADLAQTTVTDQQKE